MPAAPTLAPLLDHRLLVDAPATGRGTPREGDRGVGRAGPRLIVVDTPPAQHALDFFEAPQRLINFLDSRWVGLLIHPAFSAGRLGLRIFQRGTQRVLRMLEGARRPQSAENLGKPSPRMACRFRRLVAQRTRAEGETGVEVGRRKAPARQIRLAVLAEPAGLGPFRYAPTPCRAASL